MTYFSALELAFAKARESVILAAEALADAKMIYAFSDLDPDTKVSRVRALDAKIDYLKGLGLNANAHPWVGDGI